MSDITGKQYEQLINSAYAAGFGSGSWQTFCEDLDTVLDGAYVSIHGHDTKIHVNTGVLSVKHSPEFIEAYKTHYSIINPYLSGIARMPLGKTLPGDALLERREARRSEFYSDWVLPQEDCLAGVGLVLYRGEERMLCLGAQIRRKDEDPLLPRTIDLYDAIGPHVRRAFQIQRTLGAQRLTQDNYREVLDTLPNAVFLLDCDRRVHHNNKPGARLLRERRLLRQDASGGLRCVDRRADTLIGKALYKLRFGGDPGERETIGLRARSTGEPFVATLVPFRPQKEAASFIDRFANPAGPAAMLTIMLPPDDKEPARRVLKQLYRLTSAEIDLACLLRDGHDLSQCADRRGVSIHTVRNQLQSIFDKTGARKQTELIVLLNRLAIS